MNVSSDNYIHILDTSIVIPLSISCRNVSCNPNITIDNTVEIFIDELKDISYKDVITLLITEDSPPSIYFKIANAYRCYHKCIKEHDEILNKSIQQHDTDKNKKDPKEK